MSDSKTAKQELIDSIKESLNALVEPINAHLRSGPEDALYSAGNLISLATTECLVTIVFTFGDKKSSQLIESLADIAGKGATVGIEQEGELLKMNVEGPDDVQ